MAAQLAKNLREILRYTNDDMNPDASTYYLLRRYDGEFKIIHMDEASAELWKAAGWEFRSHSSHEEARAAMDRWKASLKVNPLQKEARRFT